MPNSITGIVKIAPITSRRATLRMKPRNAKNTNTARKIKKTRKLSNFMGATLLFSSERNLLKLLRVCYKANPEFVI
jgi:hypothetical protein